MYVLVNDQKVYFQAVDPPRASEPRKLKFTTDFALKEGNNNVLVVAREMPDFASRRRWSSAAVRPRWRRSWRRPPREPATKSADAVTEAARLRRLTFPGGFRRGSRASGGAARFIDALGAAR